MSLFRAKNASIYYVQDALFLGANIPPSTGEVKAYRTPLEHPKAKQHLSVALTAVLGRKPNTSEVKMLVAQSDLETRGWTAMWNHNYGNSVASKAPWFRIPGDTSHRYKSFPNANSGALYYVTLLKKKFGDAWKHLGSGNPTAFAQALKNQNYFEAPVDTYAKGLAARYKKA